jgi:type IV secretion system protein VirB9
MKGIVLVAGVLSLWAWAARAEGEDRMSAEGRIRTVVYDPDEVVTIDAVVGIVVHVVLEPGETYLTHAFGDGKAWDFAYRLNHLFLKAVATDADSNLTVVTDRRSYHFEVRLRTDRGAVPTYELAFRYRESRVRKEAKDSRERLEEAFRRPPSSVNLRYSMSGDLDIAPLNCWDDGQFTSFKFGATADLPAIYAVDRDGKESLVNRHTAGSANEIVVMHKVAERWVVRLGGRALLVWNDAYAAPGRTNESGTSVADVKRVLWR